ncbi:hypothetical protein QQ045_016145 [Rhodiola kirilowii]
MCVVQPTTPASEPAAIIITNIMRTFAVLSQFETARDEILQYSGLINDIVHCTELELVTDAVDAALQTIARVSVSLKLQNALLKAGVLWYLLPLLLQYDSTADESDTAEAHGVGSSIQITKNLLAIRASQALSRLSGLCSDDIGTPYNEVAADSIRALLTPKLASLLKDQMPKDLLSRLNSNLESPEIIWNSSTRAELLQFVDEQRASKCPDGSYELKDVNMFAYKALSKELYVGHVYLRVYNDQPDFEISDPDAFCTALLDFIASLVHSASSSIVQSSGSVESYDESSEKNGNNVDDTDERQLDVDETAEQAVMDVKSDKDPDLIKNLCLGLISIKVRLHFW